MSRSDVYLTDDGVMIEGRGSSKPVLEVKSKGHWDLSEGKPGDVRIGDAGNFLKFGVALGGAGEGHAGIRTEGTNEMLHLGVGDERVSEIRTNGIEPGSHYDYDLGKSGNRWQEVFAGTVDTESLVAGDVESDSMTNNGNLITDLLITKKDAIMSDVLVERLKPPFSLFESSTSITCDADLVPDSSDDSLGVSDDRWGHVYADEATVNQLNRQSDARLKSGVSDLEASPDALDALRPVAFDWSDDEADAAEDDPDATADEDEAASDSDRQLGFLAQDVRAEFPELVSEDPDGYLAVDYAGLVPVLVDALQRHREDAADLQAETESLRAENESLREEVDDLRDRLADLESTVRATEGE